MQKLKNNTYATQYQRLYFLLSLWYSNEFYIDLKAISCRIEWYLFQVYRPKHTEVIIFILACYHKAIIVAFGLKGLNLNLKQVDIVISKNQVLQVL